MEQSCLLYVSSPGSKCMSSPWQCHVLYVLNVSHPPVLIHMLQPQKHVGAAVLSASLCLQDLSIQRA